MVKKILLFFMLLSAGLNAQNYLSVHFDQVFAGFVFTDSYGKPLANLTSALKTSYAMNYKKVLSNGFFLRAEIGNAEAGAESILNTEKLDWDLHYVTCNLGGGYILSKLKFRPYAGLALYGSYLYKANQTIGTDYYDMIAQKSIKTADFGIDGYAGVLHTFASFASCFLEVGETRGLNQLEYDPGQHLYNKATSFRFGLAFLMDGIGAREAVVR